MNSQVIVFILLVFIIIQTVLILTNKLYISLYITGATLLILVAIQVYSVRSRIRRKKNIIQTELSKGNGFKTWHKIKGID